MSTKKNAAYNIAYRVFSMLLPLVTAPWLSRMVGQHGVGLYSYAWSISEIFVILGLSGLADYGVRAIARVQEDKDALHRTFSEIYLMQVITASAVLLLWLGYVFFVAGQERIIALSLTMMSLSCLVNPDWCLMGLGLFKPVALRNTAVKLLAAVCVFLFVRGPETLWVYGFVWSLATLAGCLLCWSSLKGKVRLQPVSLSAAMKHFLPCAVLLISVLAVRVYRTMDKVMVGAIAGMAENGLYENAEKIVYCLSGFISAIGTVMMPKAASLLKKGDTQRVLSLSETSMHLIMAMTCAMGFGLYAIALPFAPLFYGEAFVGSGPLMAPLGLTLILIGFANVIRTHWVLPQGQDRIFVASVVCGAVLNLAANLLLIPKLGAQGAVIGTLIAETTVPVVQYLFLRKALPYGRYARIAGLYIATGLFMVIGLRGLEALLPLTGWLGIFLRVMAGGVLYGLGVLGLWRITGLKPKLRKKTVS